MAIKKSELYSSIWESCDELRGGMDASQYNLASTSNVFGKGHHIRIDITSSNFPRFERNMNTGNAFREDAAGIPALQTIYHQRGYVSYIDLPVIPAGRLG